MKETCIKDWKMWTNMRKETLRQGISSIQVHWNGIVYGPKTYRKPERNEDFTAFYCLNRAVFGLYWTVLSGLGNPNFTDDFFLKVWVRISCWFCFLLGGQVRKTLSKKRLFAICIGDLLVSRFSELQYKPIRDFFSTAFVPKGTQFWGLSDDQQRFLGQLCLRVLESWILTK